MIDLHVLRKGAGHIGFHRVQNRLRRLDKYAVAFLHACHPLPCFPDKTDHFMAEFMPRQDIHVFAAMQISGEIGPADRRTHGPNDDIVRAAIWNGAILYPDIFHPMVNQRPHPVVAHIIRLLLSKNL